MTADEVIGNLTEMIMVADNEKSYVTLNEAVKIIKAKEQHKISVPCRIGDKLYSIIGEKVNSYTVTGFRIDGDRIYMESKESMLFPEDKFGQYYFWSQELAEREFRKRMYCNTAGGSRERK